MAEADDWFAVRMPCNWARWTTEAITLHQLYAVSTWVTEQKQKNNTRHENLREAMSRDMYKKERQKRRDLLEATVTAIITASRSTLFSCIHSWTIPLPSKTLSVRECSNRTEVGKLLIWIRHHAVKTVGIYFGCWELHKKKTRKTRRSFWTTEKCGDAVTLAKEVCADVPLVLQTCHMRCFF